MKMNRLICSIVVTALLFAPTVHGQQARAANTGIWNLPVNLDDKNVKVTFELDTTWHQVEGKTSSIIGKAWLKDPQIARSVNVELMLPVGKFNTDNESRDETLREIMDAEKYPEVKFRADGLLKDCLPAQVQLEGRCQDALSATLQIRDVAKKLELPVEITYQRGRYEVSGEVPLKWEEFGVEDPSIFLVATVDPVVKIIFSVQLDQPAL